MGTLSFTLLTLMFVVVAKGDFASIENENEESCTTWKCTRKQAFQLHNEESIGTNEFQPLETMKHCVNWQCKREMLLRSRFLNANRAALEAEAAIKQPSAVEGDEAPQEGKLQPQMTVDEEPCLTKDCRTGKRSMKEHRNEGKTALIEKLRLLANSEDAPVGCIAWHCTANGKKR